MSLRETLHHDAPPAAVHAILVDERFQSQAVAATGALDHHVEVRPGQVGEDEVVTRRTLPTDRAPEVARTMIGPSVAVTQTTRWGSAEADGSRTAHVTIEITGVPVRIVGTMRLTGGDDGTDQVVDLEVTSKVPLIGRRLVEAADPLLRSAMRAEHEAARRWLDDPTTPVAPDQPR